MPLYQIWRESCCVKVAAAEITDSARQSVSLCVPIHLWPHIRDATDCDLSYRWRHTLLLWATLMLCESDTCWDQKRGKGVREWSMRGHTHWSMHPSTYLSIFDHIWAHLNTFYWNWAHLNIVFYTFTLNSAYIFTVTHFQYISCVSLQLVWNEGIGHKGLVILSLVPPFQMVHSSLILSWGDGDCDGDGVEWMNRP